MDLNTFPLLDSWPFLSEFLHHFLPHEERLIGQLIHSLLRLFLEHEEAETALDNGCFLHEEFQVGIGNPGLMHPPVLGDNCGCLDRAFWTLEHHAWDFDLERDFIFVGFIFSLFVVW